MGQGIWSKMTGMFSNSGQSMRGEDETENKKTGENQRFSVFMPSSHEDALRSADAMRSGSGIVINGEFLDREGYQRVTDFLDGAAYVLGGTGRRVSDSVQVYAPASMEIVDETAFYYRNMSVGKK